jgi:hypothetical protein
MQREVDVDVVLDAQPSAEDRERHHAKVALAYHEFANGID